jgi:acyl-coenzyme A synthetase/AMP-(fatty) acid ligase
VGAGPGSLLIDHTSETDEPSLALGAGDDAAFAFDDAFDPQLVFFTSGSTGAPKQAPKKMSQIDAEARYWVDWFGSRADHVAGSVSHQHIYGLIFRVAVPVIAGWRSTDRQAFAWESFVTEITPRSVVVTSPAHLTRIPPGLESASPAFVLSSGQALPLAGALEADKLFGAPPVEILGSTETGGVAIRQRRDDAEPWMALGGVTLNLDTEGVLNVGSPFAGGETQRMGDRAEILTDGRFRLLARIDRVVKIEGKRVSLARVEDALVAQSSVREAVALALGAEGSKVLAVVIVLSAEGASELGELGAFRFTRQLRKHLSEGLEPAERPKRWRFVAAIPVNSQGKRVQADLQKLFEPAG